MKSDSLSSHENGRLILKKILRAFIYPPEVLLSEQFAFGHLEIYQRFFDLPRAKILFAELQHGWSDDYRALAQISSSNRVLNRRLKHYPLLTWSQALESSLKSLNYKSVYAISSPWSLLLTNYNNSRSKGIAPNYFETPRSALYFPTHSFPGEEAFFDASGIERIFKSQNFSLITTSLYWIDFINPQIREQFESFSKVICMGIRATAATETPWGDIGGRINFLYHLHKAISEHQYIICDEISTAAMAALTLGKQVFITRDKINYKLIHRAGKPFCFDNNPIIISKYGLNKSKNGLGYNLSENSDLQELAKRGFGFDISIEKTRRTLERFLGNPSVDIQNTLGTESKYKFLWDVL